MVPLTFFLGVNRSGPGMSSTTNHKIYMALGQRHGPWCKEPLKVRQRVLKSTPDPKLTLINTSRLPTLYYLEPFPVVYECPCPQGDSFRYYQWHHLISGLHYLHVGQVMGSTLSHVVQSGFMVACQCLFQPFYTPARGGGDCWFQPLCSQSQGHRPTKHKGYVPMMQGDSFPSEPSGIMEVAMWLCAPLRVGLWYSLGLVHNYVVLIFSNERWGSSSYARSSYTGPMDWFKEASGFDFEYSSNIQWRLKIFFLSLYLCVPQRLIYNFFLSISTTQPYVCAIA